MASKETGIAAPAIAWASAWLGVANGMAHPSRDTARRATIRMTMAACVGVAFELAARVHALGGLGGDRPHAIFRASTPWEATALALGTLPRALSLILVPQPPRPDYSPTEAALVHPNGALVVVGALLVVAALVAVLAHARRPTAWTLALVFAVATFAPASNLVIRSGVVLADRTLYSPSVGAALVYGGALAAAWRARARLVLGAAAAITLVAIILTVRAVPIWHDSLTVIAAMRERAPTSYRSFSISASERDGAGDYATAHAYYIRSIALFGLDPDLLQRAADNALAAHDTAYALVWLDQALRLDSARSVTRTALARLLIKRGDTARARVSLAGRAPPLARGGHVEHLARDPSPT